MTITCPICELDLAISPYPVDCRALGDQPCFLCTKFGTFDGELMTARVRMIIGLSSKINADLRSADVPAHLLTATWAGVSMEARAAIPVTERREIINGRIPGRGWGLQGSDGAEAFVALLRLHVRNWYARRLLLWDGWSPLTFPVHRIVWIDWASMCTGWDPALEEGTMEHMTSAPILILDGLGSERRRHDRKFGRDVLARLVAAREATSRPILWTSTPLIGQFYGAEICSQLVERNPGVVIGSGSGQMPRSDSPCTAECADLAAKPRADEAARSLLPKKPEGVYIAGAGMVAEVDNTPDARELRAVRHRFISAVFAQEDRRRQ